MSRRLIIGILVVLILGVVGGTGALLWQRFRSDEPTPPAGQADPFGQLGEADRGSQQIANPTGDDDRDGLTNADEALWGTNALVADTDGDGFSDGDEVANRHNPTIPAPNDTLPDGFDPARDLTPLNEAPVRVDELFAENVLLAISEDNLTDAYEAEVPESARNETALASFVQAQPTITRLPNIQESSLRVQPAAANSAAMRTYLETAGVTDLLASRAVFGKGLNELTHAQNPSGLLSMSLQLRIFRDDLRAMAVPSAAVSYHRLLLGYVELLAATIDQVALWNEDPVKAMVAIRQLDQIDRQYYPLIVQERNRLRAQTQ